MRKITQLKEKLLFIAVYLCIVFVFRQFDILCLFQHFLGIPCPGCGMTRAMLAVLQLDFAAAFRYHPMFWSIPILLFYFFFDSGLFKSKKANAWVLGLIAAGFLCQWAIKLSKIAELC